jgi:hypothetical protein
MRHALMSRQQPGNGYEVSDAGQLEPIDPIYMKPVKDTGIKSHNKPPSEPTKWMAPVVDRHNRTIGMRYQYADGAVRQPLQDLGHGTKLGMAVWSSEFQPMFHTRHNWGFNDALFQAGFPGFNLGLSFKAPQLVENPTGGPGYNMTMKSRPRFTKVQRVGRAVNKPQYYNTTSLNG